MHSYLVTALVHLAVATHTPVVHQPTVCEKAFATRAIVVQRFNRSAAGRNICRFGVKHSDASVTHASYDQKRRYLFQLRALTGKQGRYLRLTPALPKQRPGGTMTPKWEPVDLAACIVHHESGGDPRASNGTHWGIGQWDLPTWRAHGGLKYAKSPLGATYDQQLEILTTALERFGCSAWCPFDPC